MAEEKELTMWQIIKRILLKRACYHEWELYKEVNVVNDSGQNVRFEHTMLCKKCGKFKKIKM